MNKIKIVFKKLVFLLCAGSAASSVSLDAMSSQDFYHAALQNNTPTLHASQSWRKLAARPWALVKNSRLMQYCKKNQNTIISISIMSIPIALCVLGAAGIAWYNRVAIFHELAAHEKTQGIFKKLVQWNIVRLSSPLAFPLNISTDKALTFILKEIEANPTQLSTWTPQDLHHLFMLAIEKQNLTIVKTLINGKMVNVNNKGGWLQSPLKNVLETKNLEIIKYLIKEGHANVNVGCYAWGRYTPLESMVLHDNLDVIKILVEIGHADVNVNQRHPLFIVINGISDKDGKGSEKFEIIKYLAEHGARLGSIMLIPKEAPQKVLAYYALVKTCDELYLTPNLATKPELFDLFAKKYLEDDTCLVDALRLIISLQDSTLMNHLVRWFITQTDKKRQKTVVDTVGKTNLILTTIDLSVLWPELFRVN